MPERAAETYVTPETAQAVLQKLLASRQFANARKLSEFLKFVTLKTTAGETAQIKEYVIALEVYGRRPDYDPKVDSIVRVEASRLRAKLREYYDSEGRNDPIRLQFPLGSYVPVFETLPEPPGIATTAAVTEPAAPVASAAGPKTYHWTAAVLAMAALTSAGLATLSRHRADTRGSIAVLPFANMSGNPAKDYFCDGLTEQITNELGRSRKLQVAARTSTLQFKERGDDVRQIGRQLHVDMLLEGSVRFAGDRVRVTARLYDTRDGNQIWANEFQRPAGDVLALQDELSAAMVQALQLGGASSDARNPRGSTTNAEALDLYMQARYLFNSRKPENLHKSIELYQAALNKDPGFALAWAGMADNYVVLGANLEQGQSQTLPLARQALARALEIDPQLSEALLTRAAIAEDGEGGGFRVAEANFRAALAANPSNANGHHWFGLNLLAMGRFKDAETEIRQAQLLDPMSLHIGANLGVVYFFNRRYQDAVSQALKLLALDPQLAQAKLLLAEGYEGMGRYAEAAHVLEDLLKNEDSAAAMSSLGHVYALCGKADQARGMIGALDRLSKTRHVSPYQPALIYTGLGQKNEALALLGSSYEQHEAPLAFLKVDPRWDPLKGDLRFQQLLRSLGLEEQP